MTSHPLRRSLLPDTCSVFAQEPELSALYGYDPAGFSDLPELFAAVLASCLPEGQPRAAIKALAEEVFGDEALLEVVLDDLWITAERDGLPGGSAAVLHFAHGFQALLSYRLSRALYLGGREALALAVKGHFTRALSVEIWPQARIGRGIWLDHALGIVIGQTAVIEDEVSLWHGVTLGSNFVDMGEGRHPVVRKGAVIGAGALLLGPIDIGAGATVAAGAIVTRDVPAGHVITGPRGTDRGAGRFGGFTTLATLKGQTR